MEIFLTMYQDQYFNNLHIPADLFRVDTHFAKRFTSIVMLHFLLPISACTQLAQMMVKR